MPEIASYGCWKSLITSELIAARTVHPFRVLSEGESIYWSEMHPEEAGRYTIVRCAPDGNIEDLLPQPFNARNRVHEYGGASYLVNNGLIFFSNFADQRLYRLQPGGNPSPITPQVDLRYADGVVDNQRNCLVCIREDHTASDREVINTVVSVDLDGADLEGGGRVLVSGNDFYSTPRISPDGTQLAWLTWNHPNMPWDGTELWVASFGPGGGLENPTCIAGGVTESIFQPEWSPDGLLYFISDRTGWWNLYRFKDKKVEALHPMQAEFGEPQWGFGMSTFGFESSGLLICSYQYLGRKQLAVLNTRTLEFENISSPFTDFTDIRVTSGNALFLAGSPTEPWSVVRLNLSTGEHTILRRSIDLTLDPGYISVPREIEFPTENGLTAFGIYYAPHNRDFVPPQGQLPPLLVMSHGGPTGAASTSLDLTIQYWTSRGFAVLDVNYGGSTGYGRGYRDRLKGQWGIVDVDDCVNGALYLAKRGEVDGGRMAITGGSAGGYTTLCALTFRQVFKAGASYYGVSDAEALAQDTHKFESRYLNSLIGPYPQARDLYIARSPIYFASQMNCALILFQGSEDKIVPPNQSLQMFEAVRAKGLPVAYLEFEGEQHGFRRAENIKRSLEAELYFYSRIFGFRLAEAIEPVKIENLEKGSYNSL